MTLSNAARTVSFYDSIATDYDDLQLPLPGHRWFRAAFRQLVRDTAPPGGLLLDLGAGTGEDALWYAEHGYRVLAYDNSPGMMKQLQKKCAGPIAEGRVSTCELGYESFLKSVMDLPSPDLVASNFGVLNHIEDPAPLFDALAQRLRPGAHVIVSVLNPLFWKDAREGWWWRAWLQSLGRNSLRAVGKEAETYRHYAAYLRRLAQPHFKVVAQAGVGALIRRSTGRHVWEDPRSLAERIEARFWKDFPLRHLGRWVFLSFRRAA